MPGFLWSLVAQIGKIQNPQNFRLTENQAQSVLHASLSMTIIINLLSGQTLLYVQVGMFEFIRWVVHFVKKVCRRVYHGPHHYYGVDQMTLMCVLDFGIDFLKISKSCLKSLYLFDFLAQFYQNAIGSFWM